MRGRGIVNGLLIMGAVAVTWGVMAALPWPVSVVPAACPWVLLAGVWWDRPRRHPRRAQQVMDGWQADMGSHNDLIAGLRQVHDTPGGLGAHHREDAS